jgi:hypothetical protein
MSWLTLNSGAHAVLLTSEFFLLSIESSRRAIGSRKYSSGYEQSRAPF